MKRLLLIFSTLLFLLQGAYALQCTIDATEYGGYYGGESHTYNFGDNRYCSVQIDMRRQTAGTGKVIAYYLENNQWVEATSWDAGDVPTSYTTKTFTISPTATAVKMYNDGYLRRWFKNFKANDVLILGASSLDLGTCVVGQSVSKTLSIAWSQQSGSISSNNSLFTVSPTSYGNASCGKSGYTTVTIKFTPTTTGSQSATITIGGKTCTVTASGTADAPTNFNIPSYTNTTANMTWTASKATNVTGYRVINKTTGATKDVSGKSTTSYTWTGLNADTDYTFAVMSLVGSTPSAESNSKSIHTYFYDPTRCVAKQYAKEHSYNKDTTDPYWGHKITASPFTVKASFELKKAKNIIGSKYSWNDYHTTSGWLSQQNKISKDDVYESGYTKFGEYTFNAYTDSIQFVTNAENNFYVKNFVAYYDYGIAGDNVDFGNVISGSTTTKNITVRYANTMGQSLSASLSGDTGFSLGTVPSKGSCEVGTITIPVTYVANYGAGTKTAKVTLSNGQTATVTITATVALAPPAGLKVTGTTNNTVSLSWNKVISASGYRIKNVTLGTTQDVSGENTTSYTWGGLNADTDYTFTVMSLMNTTPSTESASVTGHTLYYDPSRCTAITDSNVYEYCDGSDVTFTINNVSPFKIKLAFELERASGMTGTKYTYVNYQTADGEWHKENNKIPYSDVPTDSYKKFGEYEYEGNIKYIRFRAETDKNFYLKNVVAYYNPGLEADALDFGTVEANSVTTQYVTVRYANTMGQSLTASISGTGFTIGSFAAPGSCAVGTIQIPVTYTAQHGFGLKQATITLGNGKSASATIKVTVAQPAPTNFRVSGLTNNSVTLSWDKVSDVDGYRINNTTLGTYQDVTGENTTSYTWGSLNADTDYTFTVMSLKNSVPSTPSAEVTGHTLFYDPTRCVVMADATELSFTSGSEKDYYFFNIPGFVVSQLPLEARFELMRADGVTDSRTIQINSWNNDGSWENKVWSTTGGNLSINNFWQFDGEIPANSKAIQFETNATKNIYLKNVVVYYKTGIKTNVSALEYNVAASSAAVTQTLNVDYANSENASLTASITGEGFSKGSLPSTASCGVGSTTLDVTFTPQAAWEGLIKTGTVTLNNGATATVSLKATVQLSPVKKFDVTGFTTTSVSLKWDAHTYATSYKLTNVTTGETQTLTGTSYTWSGLNSGTQYQFSIVAVRDVESEASVVSVRTKDLAPANFAASNIEQTTMTLSWDAVPTVTSDYKLVNTTTGASQRVSGTSVDLTGLTAETWYEFDLYSMHGDEEQEKTSLKVRTELDGAAEYDGKGYPTIQAAIEAAAGGEVRILRNTTENLIIASKVLINGNNKTIGDITITTTGSLELVEKPLTAGTFIIKSESLGNAFKSGQYYSGMKDALNLSGDAYIDITLDPDGKGSDNKWYSFTVPFPVEAQEGVYKMVGDEAVKGVWWSTYVIVNYDGAGRAAGGDDWVESIGDLTPGILYQIGTDGTNVFRFKKKAGSALVTENTTFTLQEYPSETVQNAGWNGIGNSALYYVRSSVESKLSTFNPFVQVYVNGAKEGGKGIYLTQYMNEVDFNVAAPFFVQYNAELMGTTLTLDRASSTKSAPVLSTSIFDVRIAAEGSEKYEDRIFVSAAADAKNEYELGFDLAKMGDLSNSTTSIMWVTAYKLALSVCRSPLNGKSADFVVRFVVPSAGKYNLTLGKEVSGATLYLTENGQVIADLTDGYTLTLPKGRSNQYGLRIVVDETTAAAEVDGQKYEKVQDAIDEAEGSEITILSDVTEDITISNKVIMNGNGHTVGNILITKDGSLELESALTAADFIIKSESEGDCFESGEYYSADADALTLTGDAYVDITLDPSGTGSDNKWYSFTVPFPVDAKEGVYKLNGDVAVKGTWGDSYIVLGYNGERQAAGSQGWAYTSAVLNPGRFYQIGTEGTNVYRFKKTADGALVTEDTSFTLEEYAGAEAKNSGWNAIGNSTLYHVNASVASGAMAFVQIYENGYGYGSNGVYITKPMSEVDFNVAAPFFVQYAPMMGSSVSLERATATKSAVDYVSSVYDVRIAADGSTGYDDRLFISAASDAKDEYEVGYDVAKMGDLSNSANAMLWVKAYNTNLSVCRAPLNGGNAEFDMSLYAPADGIYNLYLGAEAGGSSALYLTKSGTKVAELSDGYSLTLKKGVNTKYGLLIEVDDIATSASDADGGDIVVTANNGIITISNIEVGDSYSIFDVSGRTIASGVASATEVKEVVAADASSRILIVKVADKTVRKVVY